MKQITLEINQRIGNRQKGQTITLETDSEGTPLDAFWRKKLKDSAIDGCVSIQKKRAKQAKPKSEAETQVTDSE